LNSGPYMPSFWNGKNRRQHLEKAR
jgi:hypothetical protein